MSEVPDQSGASSGYARGRVTPQLISEVRSAIAETGAWEIEEEWRISTFMFERVEILELRGRRWVRVTVRSGSSEPGREVNAEQVADDRSVVNAATMRAWLASGLRSRRSGFREVRGFPAVGAGRNRTGSAMGAPRWRAHMILEAS